jgi:hypothetical protein
MIEHLEQENAKKVVYPFNLNRTATAEQKQTPKNAAESGKRGLQRQRHCRHARDDGIPPSLVEDDTQHWSRARGMKERTRRDTAIAGKRTLWRTEKTTTVTGFSGCPVAGQQPRSTAQFTWTLINAIMNAIIN